MKTTKRIYTMPNIAFLQERINQTKNKEYKLMLVYEADKSEANWNALCDIRRHGQLQEEHLNNLINN
jgi:hypothetical protein